MSKPLRILFCLIFYILVYLLYPPEYSPFSRGGYEGGFKNCFRNQRVILGAIEMYNMDNTESICELNENVLEILYKKKYLYNKIEGSVKGKCKYLNHGDLTQDGFLYCEFHGYYNYEKTGDGIPPSKEVGKYMKSYERIHFIKHYTPAFLIIIVVTSLAIFL